MIHGMNGNSERLKQIVEKLKANGCRLTPQRLAVLRFLAETQTHPSAEMIYEHVKKDFPTTSLATVYKTVTLAKELGEILEIGLAGGSNRYDGFNPSPHPHLICLECQKIMDPDLDALDGMTEELAKDTGFKIVNHRVDFFGVCPECQSC